MINYENYIQKCWKVNKTHVNPTKSKLKHISIKYIIFNNVNKNKINLPCWLWTPNTLIVSTHIMFKAVPITRQHDTAVWRDIVIFHVVNEIQIIKATETN